MMNINSHITSMNTDTKGKYFATTSHPTAPTRLFPASICTGVPALPCFSYLMQGCCSYPCQSLAFPPTSPIIPVTSPHQHQFFHCTSPQSQNQIPTNKSFLIKDILGTTDSSFQTTKATGDSQQSGNKQLQSMPRSMFSFYVLPTQKERNKQLGYSRTRTMFTQAQINGLEENFKKKKYLSTPARFELADNLGLNPVIVKTWYQNKRMKWKKEVQKVDPSCNPTQGRPTNGSLYDTDAVEDQIIVD